MRRILHLLLVAGLCPAGFAIDTLSPSVGPVMEGTFVGYEFGSFSLINKEHETMKHLVADTRELQIDPPREITVTPRAGKPESMMLKGFEKGQFIFLRNGVEAPRPLSLIKRIEVPFTAQLDAIDLSGPAVTPDPAPPAPSAPAAPPTPRAPPAALPAAHALAEAGRVTVVHFHYPPSVTSMRQGSLVAALVRDSRGKVALRKIEIPDWNAPAVEQYDLKSLPQFWFYNARGELVSKLVDRFTDEDVTAALRQAQR